MNIISRSDAKAAGLKRYFTGEPCKRGHAAERRVSTAECIACSITRDAERYQMNIDRSIARAIARAEADSDKFKVYREKNKDRIKGQVAAHYKENKDRIRARQAAYYEANKEKVLAQRKVYRAAKRAEKVAT
jgi:hypothetical protein